jgi:hypothetical protein
MLSKHDMLRRRLKDRPLRTLEQGPHAKKAPRTNTVSCQLWNGKSSVNLGAGRSVRPGVCSSMLWKGGPGVPELVVTGSAQSVQLN